MSHYAKIQVKFLDQKALVEALVAVGVPRGEITVHEDRVAIKEYHGENTANLAHVVINRHWVGAGKSGYNEIGFDCSPGEPKAYICDWARDRAKFDVTWLAKLTQEYVFTKTKQHYAAQGKQVSRVNENNRVYLYVRA